ncbi:MAG: hypothetical protein ACRC9X_03455 [Bacteroidales bacterium]
MLRGLFIAILLMATLTCKAISDSTVVHTGLWEGAVRVADWSRPLWADMHSTLIRGEVAYGLNSAEYDFAGNSSIYRPYVFANIGADLPVWAGNFYNHKYGFSLTVPFMIDVWLDMFERSTAPVINTGYRFGLPDFSFIHRFKSNRRIHNYVIKLSPLKHECTHIGDELTIMRKNKELPLTRINVSYNYTELMLRLNDPDGTRNSRHTFALGLMVLHDWAQGWYNIMPEEGDQKKVIASEYPFEVYAHYQYQTKTYKTNLQGIFSIEARNRSKYNYPMYYTDKDEEWVEYASPEFRSYSFNAFIGLRYNSPSAKSYFSKIGVGLRGYLGINPYGQFRSIHNYQQLGLAIIFE